MKIYGKIWLFNLKFITTSTFYTILVIFSINVQALITLPMTTYLTDVLILVASRIKIFLEPCTKYRGCYVYFYVCNIHLGISNCIKISCNTEILNEWQSYKVVNICIFFPKIFDNLTNFLVPITFCHINLGTNFVRVFHPICTPFLYPPLHKRFRSWKNNFFPTEMGNFSMS